MMSRDIAVHTNRPILLLFSPLRLLYTLESQQLIRGQSQ